MMCRIDGCEREATLRAIFDPGIFPDAMPVLVDDEPLVVCDEHADLGPKVVTRPLDEGGESE